MPELPPQRSIGLTIHEAAGEKDTTRFLIPEQVTPAGKLASHTSPSWRKRFEYCECEGAERWGSLHGRSILGKCATIATIT